MKLKSIIFTLHTIFRLLRRITHSCFFHKQLLLYGPPYISAIINSQPVARTLRVPRARRVFTICPTITHCARGVSYENSPTPPHVTPSAAKKTSLNSVCPIPSARLYCPTRPHQVAAPPPPLRCVYTFLMVGFSAITFFFKLISLLQARHIYHICEFIY